jgi:hypothetical protein
MLFDLVIVEIFAPDEHGFNHCWRKYPLVIPDGSSDDAKEKLETEYGRGNIRIKTL